MVIYSNTSFRALSFFLVAGLLQSQMEKVRAFAVTRSAPSKSSSRLQVSTIYSDFTTSSKRRLPIVPEDIASVDSSISATDFNDMTSFAVPSATTVTPDRTILRKMEMPKHGPSREEIQNAKFLISLEMTIGRGAMLLAVLLMAMELSTGMSLPEQIFNFLSSWDHFYSSPYDGSAPRLQACFLTYHLFNTSLLRCVVKEKTWVYSDNPLARLLERQSDSLMLLWRGYHPWNNTKNALSYSEWLCNPKQTNKQQIKQI